jgi:hypothetical protein
LFHPKVRRQPRGTHFAGLFRWPLALPALGAGALMFSSMHVARADCRLEVELLGADLKGVALTEQQKLQLAPLVDDALKRCRLGREDAALHYLDKARAVAGITRKPDELGSPSPATGPVR